ncbi:hypothetical protein PMIN06_011510 [Paraphaeosphaeria minitans]
MADPSLFMGWNEFPDNNGIIPEASESISKQPPSFSQDHDSTQMILSAVTRVAMSQKTINVTLGQLVARQQKSDDMLKTVVEFGKKLEGDMKYLADASEQGIAKVRNDLDEYQRRVSDIRIAQQTSTDDRHSGMGPRGGARFLPRGPYISP